MRLRTLPGFDTDSGGSWAELVSSNDQETSQQNVDYFPSVVPDPHTQPLTDTRGKWGRPVL